jgi:hypothetical protein
MEENLRTRGLAMVITIAGMRTPSIGLLEFA